MSSSKRDLVPPISVRLTPEEDVWLRRHAAHLDMDLAELMRKSLAVAVPMFMGNPFLCRVELKDARTDPECMQDS